MGSSISSVGAVRRSVVLCSLLLIVPLAASQAIAQGIPQQNVNAIGPTPVNWLLAGNARKQQNEPECAVAPGNTNWLFCGYNDYRAVDFPIVGDAFPGVSMSRDGGRSWISGLHPGHLADSATLGQQFGADANVSAVPGFLMYNFIAGWRNDERPGGMFVARWYEHNRESGPPWEPLDIVTVDQGTAGRFLDKPAFATSLADPGAGMPDVIIPIPQYNDPRNPNNIVPAFDLEVPAGRTHLVYSVFVGNDNNSGTKMMYRASDDWGATWPISSKLSESSEINQGATIATRDFGNQVLVTWRRFSDNNESSAIMMAFLAGNKWTMPQVVANLCAFDQTTGAARFRTNTLPVVTSDGADFYVFYADRGPGGLTCFDENGNARQSDVIPEDDFFGPQDEKIPMAANFSRIMMVRSRGKNNLQWSAPVAVDAQEHSPGVRKRGHQFMPAAMTAGGITTVSWYDSRRDKLNLRQNPVAGAFVEDLVLHIDGTSGTLIPAGAYEQVPPPAELPPTTGNYPFRRTVDIYAAQLIVDGQPHMYLVDNQDYVASTGGQKQPSTRVSRYPVGKNPVTGNIEQLEYNYPNGRLFQKGKAPFIGDYNSVFATEYRRRDGDGAWVPNADKAPGALTEPTFHLAWTSNHNVRGDVYYTGCDVWDETLGMWVAPPGCASQYGAPNVPATPIMAPLQGEEGEDSIGVCSPATPNALTRNQNIFVAALRPELSLSVLSAIKTPNGNLRTYVVLLTNASPATRSATLSLPTEIPARASFKKDDTSISSIPVVLPGRSSAVRTVFTFVNTDPTDDIILTLRDDDDVNAVAQAALKFDSSIPFENVFTDDASNPIPANESEVFDILLDKDRIVSTQNLDLENLDLENTVQLLDLENLDLENLDLENLDLENRVIYFQDLQNLDLENLDLENLLYQQQNVEILDLENLDLENRLLFLDLENLDLENLDLENLDLENLDLENFTIFASDVENLDLENLDLENLDLENSPYTEVSWQLKTETNTTTGVDVKPIVTDALKEAIGTDGKAVQLFVTSAYQTSTITQNQTADNFCSPKVVVNNQVLYNSVLSQNDLNDSSADPDAVNDPAAPSFFLEPDKSAIVTLRFYHNGNLEEDFINSNLGIAMYSQGGGAANCDEEAETGDSTIIESCEIDRPDTTPPVLNGLEPPQFVPSEPFVLAADANTFQVSWGPVTATDDTDPDVTVNCTPGTLDTNKDDFTFMHDFAAGSTEVTCTATDISGNAATGTFTVSVADMTAPVISLTGPNPQTIAGGDAYVELGATAVDNVDGDVSGQIIIDASAVDTLIPGSYPVSYTVSDSSGNSNTVTRTVIVTDTMPPVLTVVSQTLRVLTDGLTASVDYLANVSATDNVDGTLPVSCKIDDAPISNPVKLQLGSVTAICSATDTSGNTGTAQFRIDVIFAFGFRITMPNGNIRAGSVVPLDWQYLDPETGAPVDSSTFSLSTIWLGPYDGNNCSGANPGTGNGMDAEDAGSSNFRYSAAQSLWQYSWQTPALPGSYLLTVSPPGTAASTVCLRLR